MIKFSPQTIIHGAKVIPCPLSRKVKPFGFSQKSPRLRCASGSIFPKNLAGQGTRN